MFIIICPWNIDIKSASGSLPVLPGMPAKGLCSLHRAGVKRDRVTGTQASPTTAELDKDYFKADIRIVPILEKIREGYRVEEDWMARIDSVVEMWGT